MVVLPPGWPVAEDFSSARSMSCPSVRSLPLCQEGWFALCKQEGKGDVFQGHLQCLFDVGV